MVRPQQGLPASAVGSSWRRGAVRWWSGASARSGR